MLSSLVSLAHIVVGSYPLALWSADTVVIKAPVVEGRGILFNRISASAGLSQPRVSQILQDRTGFIWFGTQDGLNRFDGYRCKVLKHDPSRPDSLSGVYIHALFEDCDGALWVGTDQLLDRFDPITETFAHYPLESTDFRGLEASFNIEHISQDRAGTLWLATRNGLYSIQPASGRVAHYRHDPSDPATISDNDVKSSGLDRAGRFWVATSTALDQFDPISDRVVRRIQIGESGMGLTFHQDVPVFSGW